MSQSSSNSSSSSSQTEPQDDKSFKLSFELKEFLKVTLQYGVIGGETTVKRILNTLETGVKFCSTQQKIELSKLDAETLITQDIVNFLQQIYKNVLDVPARLAINTLLKSIGAKN